MKHWIPGFRFSPTDGQLIVHYLIPQIQTESSPFGLIKQVDLINDHHPWELAELYAGNTLFFQENEWYFFTARNRKYPHGRRPNRTAIDGSWKPTQKESAVTHEGRLVGYKTTLDYYSGHPRDRQQVKTQWKMHEYKVNQAGSAPTMNANGQLNEQLDKWVLCKIYINKRHKGQEKDHEFVTHSIPQLSQHLSINQAELQVNSASLPVEDVRVPRSNQNVPINGAELQVNPISVLGEDVQIPWSSQNLPINRAELLVNQVDVPVEDVRISRLSQNLPINRAELQVNLASVPVEDVRVQEHIISLPNNNFSYPNPTLIVQNDICTSQVSNFPIQQNNFFYPYPILTVPDDICTSQVPNFPVQQNQWTGTDFNSTTLALLSQQPNDPFLASSSFSHGDDEYECFDAINGGFGGEDLSDIMTYYNPPNVCQEPDRKFSDNQSR